MRTVVLCPATQAHRDAVVQSVHNAASLDSDLASLIQGHTDVSILLASLGAPLQGPWQQRSEGLGPYGTLVGLAGPIWSKEFDEFL